MVFVAPANACAAADATVIADACAPAIANANACAFVNVFPWSRLTPEPAFARLALVFIVAADVSAGAFAHAVAGAFAHAVANVNVFAAALMSPHPSPPAGCRNSRYVSCRRREISARTGRNGGNTNGFRHNA